jgi:hypothetical protein
MAASHLDGMLLVVHSQAAHSPHILGGQGRQQQPDIGHLLRHLVLSEDAAGDDTSLLGLANVGLTRRQDGIAVIRAAILGQEAD